MKLKDATRNFGSVRPVFFPLVLIFLTAAGSTFASTNVAYRTQAVNTIPTTVITYRAPATYKRRGNDLYDTRGTKYVAVRRTVVSNGNVAIRNANYTTNGTRYIAVRNDAPRYLAVQRSSSYIDDKGTRYVAVRSTTPSIRYVAVRSGYRTGNGIVGYIDVNDDTAVRRSPAYVDDDVRYVAVRNYTPSTRYVAVRRDLADDDVIALPDNTVSATKSVVIRDDKGEVVTLPDESVSTTKYVAVQNADYNDEAMTLPVASTSRTITEFAPAAYHDGSNDVAITETAEVIDSGTTAAIPASYYDNDQINDLAYLDGGGATFVANDDIEYASLRPTSVSYIPVSEINAESALPVRHAVVVDNETVNTDATYVVPNANGAARTVTVVPVEEAPDIDNEAVAYVPVSNASFIEPTNIATAMTPVEVADTSTVLVDDQTVTDISSTEQIASGFGYRDGFADGQDAALEGDVYHPENSGDYQKATEGYEDTFGDKDVYKGAYRTSYLNGYRAGFDSSSSGG